MRRAGSMRSSARNVTLLPDPDSPSRPSTSPWLQRDVDAVERVHGALALEAHAHVLHFDDRGHASFGTFVWKSVAPWNATPSAASASSPNGRPMICRPIGMPCWPKPAGTTSAGSPR